MSPVPEYPEDFGGLYTEELTNEHWLAACRNIVEEHFRNEGSDEGHHSPFVIVAFRNAREPDTFNDLVGGYNLTSGELRLWRATADPGKAPMERAGAPVHPDGVARLRPGMTRSCLKYGYHHNDMRHPALVQCANIPFERYQADRTWQPVEKPTIRGFNVHRARFSGSVKWVGDWSQGCLVFPDRHAHWAFLQWIGYPTHGPQRAPINVRNRRHSLVIFNLVDTE